MRMSRDHWDDLIAHAREDDPHECCGYLVAREGVVETVVRGVNERHSAYGYDLDGPSLIAANAADDDGFEVAVYHSHPRSPAEPSQQDINTALYPHWTYVIVTLLEDDGQEPRARAWGIVDGKVEEREIVVD